MMRGMFDPSDISWPISGASTERAESWIWGGEPTQSQPRVLYIDDDESNRRLMVKLLSRHRPAYEVLTAATGHEGLEIARRESLSIVLLDVNLPDGPVENILADLSVKRRIPVVMVTGDADDESAQRFMEAGAVAYVTKPFDVLPLMTLIDEAKRPDPFHDQGKGNELKRTFHDIRNELHVLIGNASLLTSSSEDDDQTGAVEDIRASAKRLRDLVDQLSRQYPE